MQTPPRHPYQVSQFKVFKETVAYNTLLALVLTFFYSPLQLRSSLASLALAQISSSVFPLGSGMFLWLLVRYFLWSFYREVIFTLGKCGALHLEMLSECY